MFKKKPKSKPKALKKRTTADDDAEHHQDQEGGKEDHDVGAATAVTTTAGVTGVAGVVSEEAAAARAVKRRRHVLTGLQYKRGVDAARLLARGGGMGGGSDDRRSGQRHEADREDDEKTRGDEPSLLPSNTKMTNESQVWKERHEKAMEDFIQSRIREQETQQVAPADAADHHDNGDGDASTSKARTTTAMVVTSKDELFRQLAETAKQLSGKNEDESLSEQQRQHQEVLRSGAATAMAEVILPSSSSSSSAAAAFTARRGPMTTTMRPRGGMHAKEGTAAATPTAATADDGRVGFAAARGIKEIKPREQSADEKAYKNFVQRQRR